MNLIHCIFLSGLFFASNSFAQQGTEHERFVIAKKSVAKLLNEGAICGEPIDSSVLAIANKIPLASRKIVFIRINPKRHGPVFRLIDSRNNTYSGVTFFVAWKTPRCNSTEYPVESNYYPEDVGKPEE